MAAIGNTLGDVITYVNSLYNVSSDTPTAGSEEYIVWTSLCQIAVNLWENEEGMLWGELFGKLADAADGDKTTGASDYSYSVPTNFRFPASGYVWLGSGTSKTAYKVIKQSELQLYENDTGRWCYFLMDASPTLEFNPNITMTAGQTISYNYYKKATKPTTGTDALEMSDPLFAAYYILSELKKEEGDASAATIASQKLEAMKTKNEIPAWFQSDNLLNKTEEGFGC